MVVRKSILSGTMRKIIPHGITRKSILSVNVRNIIPNGNARKNIPIGIVRKNILISARSAVMSFLINALNVITNVKKTVMYVLNAAGNLNMNASVPIAATGLNIR
ncbi:MAG TPA: hypothetical protein DCP36_20255 [Sporomusaceae bacterium]|nr:hypothetical protein [Sporomusaceae bacterium]